jgi:hypothetical protein
MGAALVGRAGLPYLSEISGLAKSGAPKPIVEF